MGKKSKKENSDSSDVKKETEEKKIDFYNGFTPKSEKNIPFPAPYKSEPRIYIEEDVFKEIQMHSTETTEVELCGILIGEVRYDVSGNYLYICGSIRGEKAKNSGVNVSFTPETWDYIHDIREKKYPDYSIIGWYHTHPGFGIFLSDMDKFIQDYFFNLPYQVALVVDPKSNQNGIFAWQEGKICPLKNCWIGKEQINLSIGTVGGEETYRGNKNTENLIITEKTVSNDSDSLKEKSNNSFYKHTFYYFLCFNLAFLLSNLFFLRITSNNATIVAQIEAKDIITSWAMDQTLGYQLESINDYLSQNIEALNNAPASYTFDVNTFKQYSMYLKNLIDNASKESKSRRNRAIELLKRISNKSLTITENMEMQNEYLKQVIADSILIQIEPYLTSLSAQPINEVKIKEAKLMLENILSISSEQEKNRIKQKYDWIFQVK